MIPRAHLDRSVFTLAATAVPALLAGVSALLSGCASSGVSDAARSSVETMAETQRVVDRTFREPFTTKDVIELTAGKGVMGPAAKAIDQAELKPAIERFAEGRRQKAGTYLAAGANLTADGKTRAVVLFTSETWCQPQGCELAIFEKGAFGWRSVATVSRVKAPIRMASSVSNGWHDLWVVTGRGEGGKSTKSFVQNVRLQYGANGYPGTTTFALAGAAASPEGVAVIEAAELDLPDKTRFATGGRNPDHNKKKIKSLTPQPAVKPATPSPS